MIQRQFIFFRSFSFLSFFILFYNHHVPNSVFVGCSLDFTPLPSSWLLFNGFEWVGCKGIERVT